jgi:hypothetical protein
MYRVSSLVMTRTQALRSRDRLAASLSGAATVLRGSLLQRTLHHSSGCQVCPRRGHPLWVLNVGYPGGKTRQISIRPQQVTQVRKAIQQFHRFRDTLEAISEINQYLLRLDRDESRKGEA